MPISDMVFSVIGVADYVLLLLIIIGTGFITRRKARTSAEQTPTEVSKRAG